MKSKNIITVRISEKQFELISAHAEKNKTTLTDALRTAAFENLEKMEEEKKITDEFNNLKNSVGLITNILKNIVGAMNNENQNNHNFRTAIREHLKISKGA